MIKTYAQKEKIINQQNQEAEAAQKEVENVMQEMHKSYNNYVKPREALESITVNSCQISNCFETKEISNLEKKIDKEASKVRQNFDEFYKLANTLCEKQNVFAQTVKQLQSSEKDLADIREQFTQANDQMGIVTQFKNKNDASYKFLGVDQYKLQEIFKQNLIENKSFRLSSQNNISININQQTTSIKNLYITNASKIKYIEFILQGGTNITFENCRFEGVGLHIRQKSNSHHRDSLFINNFSSDNSCSTGISVSGWYLKCSIENSHINNSSDSGIKIINLGQGCNIKNVEVSNSRKHGFSISSSSGSIIDSTIQNSAEYGIYLQRNKQRNTEFQTSNIVFKDNGAGNIAQRCYL
eukprot:TRINITY_DN8246_c0_g2_i1.p1 TRINITY_DN8246_c0_g2~~TRINITY_DN8246_c0_g2_i1.p1  ORF type:complete len:355 (+),score=15.79 TRINITY_DN8246_c0_g2_i1:201-1265(+)